MSTALLTTIDHNITPGYGQSCSKENVKLSELILLSREVKGDYKHYNANVGWKIEKFNL